MATSVSINGTSYSIPAAGERDWAGSTKMDGAVVALANHTLQKVGGTFTLAADVDFGAAAGLKTAYLKSRNATVAAAGIIRLGNNEDISWRDVGDSTDLALTVNASDQLEFNGAIIATLGGSGLIQNNTLEDSTVFFVDNGDTTKKFAVQCSGITTSTTRTWTVPDADSTFVGIATAQTLTNKTIDADNNTISNLAHGAEVDEPSSGVHGVAGSIVGTSDSQTLTNKTIDADNNTISNLAHGAEVDEPSSGVHGVSGSIVGTSDSQTLSNKTFSDAPILAEIATPSTPSSGFGKVYFKSDGKLYQINDAGTESEVGSGGSAGINYIANPDANSDTTGWATYSDVSDGTTPATSNGTGGSATATWTRTTSTPLRDEGSFLLTKSAADLQGEGASYDFTIDEADKGKRLSVSFDFSASSALVVGESADVRVFIYDKDNTTLLYPSNIYLLGASGKYQAVFDATDADDYRLILHIATTNATAWTLKVDNVQVGPQELVMAPPVGDWQSFTPTINNITGTFTGKYRRVGDSVEFDISADITGAGSGTITMSLPNNWAIDTNKTSTATAGLAEEVIFGIARATDTGTAVFNGYVTYLSANSVRFTRAAVWNTTTPHTWASGDGLSARFVLPISNFTSSAVLTNSQTFRMAPILANGTRVTGAAPTALGEYRSFLRNATANTYTETNGDPTTAPTSADGILIYNGATWGTADTNNEPTRYDIFVGKNKHVQFQWYGASGKTDNAFNFVLQPNASSFAKGYAETYDPTTGVVSVFTLHNSNATGHTALVDEAGNNIAHGYFDIIVSEKVLPVVVEADHSSVVCDTGNGHGSTGTKIRKFTNSTTLGSAITYASDPSNNGDTFTINKAGMYAITYSDVDASAAEYIGVSLNSAQLTTSIGSITSANRLAISATPAGAVHGFVSAIAKLEVGDVIRAHTSGNPDGTGVQQMFKIIRIGD